MYIRPSQTYWNASFWRRNFFLGVDSEWTLQPSSFFYFIFICTAVSDFWRSMPAHRPLLTITSSVIVHSLRICQRFAILQLTYPRRDICSWIKLSENRIGGMKLVAFMIHIGWVFKENSSYCNRSGCMNSIFFFFSFYKVMIFLLCRRKGCERIYVYSPKIRMAYRTSGPNLIYSGEVILRSSWLYEESSLPVILDTTGCWRRSSDKNGCWLVECWFKS